MKNLLKIILFTLSISTIALAQKNKPEGIFAEITTSKGVIVVALNYQKTPITVANFISLAEGKNPNVKEELKKKPYYNGLKFHRVIPDFMIQGGCPDGNGSGGPGYKFVDEITDLVHDKAGILSMANAGAGTNGSQFFITHKETPWLDGKHTVFGTVTSGIEIVNKIAKDDTIISIVIVKNGKEAKKFKADKVFQDYFANKEENDKIQVVKNEAAKKAFVEKEAALQKIKAEKEEKLKKEAEIKVKKEFATATTTASGLKYKVIKEGTGKKPVATSNVKVHYTGMFLNGQVFDSSVQRGEPIDFGLNQVIPGWTEGVQLMQEGAKYKFYIPSNLAYGENGAGGVIPPNADLLFEVELLKINN